MPLKPITPNPDGDKKIYLLKPRGFCAGVVRAIDVVKIALNLYGRPVYVRKEIVHNKHVVEELRALGAVFVEELDEVPDGGRAIFSAHGVSPEVRRQGKQRGLSIIDATCPLVTKVHLEAVKFAREGYTIVLIGHKNHDEVIGTLGEAPNRMFLVESVKDVDALNIPDPTHVAYLTQTTLSLDETRDIMARLLERFPLIRGPKSQDICYATENRQMAVKGVAQFCDLLLVVGSANSSNSKRLVEVGQNYGVQSFLVNDWSDVNPAWLRGADNEAVRNVGVTAGASAPEHLVEQIVTALRNEGYGQLEEIEMIEEDVRFSLPSELNRISMPTGGAGLQSIAR
jgi:4-hydroxy-3-methylbut-2-enyl diphosphate reductase